jgi:hypothetical protein
MMLTNTDMHYLVAVWTKLQEGAKTDTLDIPSICPECGDPADINDDAHIAIEPDDSAESPLILIGCEGYHTVDPSFIGLPRGNWDKYRHNDE